MAMHDHSTRHKQLNNYTGAKKGSSKKPVVSASIVTEILAAKSDPPVPATAPIFVQSLARTNTTTTTASSDSALELLCSDAGAQITTPEQLATFLPSADPTLLLIGMIGEFHAERKQRLVLTAQMASLCERMDRMEGGWRVSGAGRSEIEERVKGLEDRQLRSEAYSGRNTVIISGLDDPGKEEEEADLEEQVVDILSVADPNIQPADIGICHRNAPRRGKHKGKPRTVTVVFLRARQKDRIMSKENRRKIRNRITDPQENGEKSGGIFHRMSRGLVERKEELEKVEGVQWAYFSGHHLFTVKFSKDGKEEIRHNIINVDQLL